MSNILSLPLEIFEMVVGIVSFVDLPHFLQTSKQIKSDFQATRYHRQLAMIPPEVLKDAYEEFVKHPKSWLHWSTHNILSTLSSPYCEDVLIPLVSALTMMKPECGDFGNYFLWCSVPALRLCAFCLDLPRYQFIRVRDALATYGLKRTDIATLPKLKCPSRSNFSTRTSVILQNMFIPISEQDKLLDVPTLTSDDFYIDSLPGTKNIKRTFEPKAGGFIHGLICGHCKGDPELFQRYQKKKLRWIPRNYTCLREHVAKRHASLLESFEQGWNNLTPHLQAKFHDPISNRLPAYFHGLPSQAMRFCTRNIYYVGIDQWSSWTHFAYNEFETVEGWAGLSDILEEKMDNISSVFGVPPQPPEYKEFPEWLPQTNVKGEIAKQVIDACLEKVKVEAMLRMERTLREEGLEGFRLILNGDSVIEKLAKVYDVSCHYPGG